MTKIIFLHITSLFIVLLFCIELQAADVMQGKCVSVDLKQKTIILQEYDTNFDSSHQYGIETDNYIDFDVSKAKMGIAPEVGDILRVLYEIDDKTRNVLLLMNVSKQHGLNK